MSLAIHITTHASESAVRNAVDKIREIVTDLDDLTSEGKPSTTWAIYGNDYSDEGHPKKDIRVDEATLAAEG
jgi:hypothetical protein